MKSRCCSASSSFSERRRFASAASSSSVSPSSSSSLGPDPRPAPALGGDEHPPHQLAPILAEEHVLGAAKADPGGAEVPRLGRVAGRVGIRPHPEHAQLIAPAEDLAEVVADLGVDQRHVVEGHRAAGPLDRNPLPHAELGFADPDHAGALVDRNRRRSATQGLPIPRATSAAWEALPPSEVRMPRAA